jgi:cytochrome c2
MYKKIIATALIALASSTVIAAGDAKNGEKLYNDSMCGTACHGVEKYTAPDKKVKDLKALEAQVRLDDTNLPTNWFDTDIHDVVAYLNEQYYKFPTPEATK